MILNFLQVRDPQILPSLQKSSDTRSTASNGQESAFADDLDRLRGYGKDNKESLGQLLFHFFRHYGYIMDYGGFVVSVKEGRLLSRKEKGWDGSNYKDKEARSRLCVEEPFNTGRNLGNSADDYAWSGIHQEIRRAFDLIKDGANLEECCAQYEFPPEEKPIFQRPTPKPKPILTRSASQTNRTNTGNGSGRGNNNTRNSRNTSNQRSNNRRASSGAAYANQRLPYATMSPPIGINPAEYFAPGRMSTDQLHDQLYKQYQYLQAQQEALRNQLMQQQTQAQMHAHAQAQAQARNTDVGVSPRQRTFAQSLPSPHSPRMFENPPNTAPLLPGYLYHYPARYPPPSPLSQARSTDDSVTDPASPSLTNATPTSRRGVHRSSVTEGSTNPSARSQSQPGRSFPNPLTLQGMVHPGYDVSGAIATPYLVQHHPLHAFSPVQANGGVRHTNGVLTAESAMPKEYVGYYVGQSPQLIPQYQTGPIPPVPQLRDPQQSTRRLSPESISSLLPNGLRHQSRSPSPLGNGQQEVILDESQAVPILQKPTQKVHAKPSAEPSRGPLIVNGSYSASAQKQQVATDARSTDSTAAAAQSLRLNGIVPTEQIQQMSLDPTPHVYNGTSQQYDIARTLSGEMSNGHHSQSQQSPLTRVSPNSRAHITPRLDLPLSNGERLREKAPAALDPPLPITPQSAVPSIMSPIEETRTPSPTMNRNPESLRAAPHNRLAQTTQVANGKRADATSNTARKETAPSPAIVSSTPAHGHGDVSARQSQHPLTNATANAWQQAPGRKNHKKSKSTAGSKGSNAVKVGGGEVMPVNEADRKGG